MLRGGAAFRSGWAFVAAASSSIWVAHEHHSCEQEVAVRHDIKLVASSLVRGLRRTHVRYHTTMFSDVLEGLVDLPEAVLDDRIRALELERRRLDAELAAAISVADHRQLPAVDGHRTINAYLRATLNWSDTEASRFRSLARAVDHLDGLGDAWHAGHIGISQAVHFGRLHGNRRVREHLPEFMGALLDHAEQLPHRDFVACVDRFTTLADADGAHTDRDDAVEHRDAHINTVGGTLDVTAHGGDGVTAAEMIAIHQRFTEAEYQADVDARRAAFGDDADQQPLSRTGRQRRFDALVAIFRRAAAADGVGTTADPLVNIVIDHTTWAKMSATSGLAPDADLDGQPIDPFTGLTHPDQLLDDLVNSPDDLLTRRCETTSGVAVHPHDVLRAALAGHIRRAVIGSDGVVIDLGRRQRLFTGSARDAAKLLIRHCEHPGCTLPVECCDVDHAEEWANGGHTNQTNGRIRCGSHNNDKTRQQWRSKRATNGHTYTIRTDGTIMLPVGTRPPTFPDNDDDNDDDPADIEHLIDLARQRLAALTAA